MDHGDLDETRMHEGLIYTNDSCVGCNRCVRVCSSFGASVASSDATGSIRINSERCVLCGACIDVCAHEAREYEDDTERFLSDLRAGEAVSVMVAPAFEAAYPKEFPVVLAALRKMGALRLLPVSLGADICTWAYVRHMADEASTLGMISTPCPVVVSYIEHWMPDLIPRLMPVKSPLMCLATYCRERLGMTERFAFLGPCIGKSLEVQRYPELVQYNVTFPRLIHALQEGGLLEAGRAGDPCDGQAAPTVALDQLDAGLGSYYPAPGGLADNIRWLLGDDTPVRVLSGKQYLYDRFACNGRGVFAQELPFALIDALNCQEGCLEGTARTKEEREAQGLAAILRIRAGSKSERDDSPWNQSLSPEERLARLNAQFADLDPASYVATFVDQSASCEVKIPTPDHVNHIFRSLHKYDASSRHIDCSACGYESCYEMVVAIHNGFNTRNNCVYFEKEEAIRLEHMSFDDQLSGVMNRNALEYYGDNLMERGRPLGLIVSDVNGLKHENDTNGHAAGDMLIMATGQALAARFGRERIFRTGGDEFLSVLQDLGADEIEAGIAAVKEQLAEFGVSVSMGMAHTDSYNDDFVSLRTTADSRMYEDKARYYATTGMKRRVEG